MLGLAFVAVGSFTDNVLLVQVLFSPFRLFLPLRRCPFFMWGLLRKSRTRGFPFFSLPSFRRAGGRGEGAVLGCFPRVFLSSHSTFVQRKGWRSLWSLVRCTRARFCLLSSFLDWGSRSCSLASDSCYRSVPVGSPSSSLHAL